MLTEQSHKLQAGTLNQPAHNHGRTRCHGGSAVGNDAGVGGGHDHIAVIQADSFGGNLSEHGVGSLAELGA